MTLKSCEYTVGDGVTIIKWLGLGLWYRSEDPCVTYEPRATGSKQVIYFSTESIDSGNIFPTFTVGLAPRPVYGDCQLGKGENE